MTDDSSNSQSSMGERLGWAAALLSVSIFLSRILGFLREAAIAYLHGASDATDAYYAAFTLPDLMNYFLAGGTLSITFIPLFSAYLADDDEAGGWQLFSNITTTMGLVLVVVMLLLEGLAPYLIPVANPGFEEGEQLAMAVWMTRIVIPAQLAFYVGGLLQATLYVREVFWPSAVAPLVYNLCIILGGILLEPWFGIAGFSVGVVVGAFLGPLGLPLWAARRHIEYSPRLDPSDADFKKFIRLSLPLMIGVGLLTADEWILRYFGSFVEGAITWLNDARKLMLVIFAIIGQAAGQAALPYLSKLYENDDHDEMGEMLAKTLRRVGFLAVVGAAGLVVSGSPLVHFVFRRGAFTAADAEQTAHILNFFAAGLVGWTLQSLAVRGFYARKNTLTPMLIGTGVFVVSLPIYWLLFETYGPPGLAAGTSIGISLNAAATILVYRATAGPLALAPIVRGLLRGLLYAAACASAAEAVRRGLYAWPGWSIDPARTLDNLLLLSLMALGFFGAGSLLTLVYRPPEVDTVLATVEERLPW